MRLWISERLERGEGHVSRHAMTKSDRRQAERKMTRNDEDSELFELVNLYPNRTGLPMTVWAGPRGNARHAPRIKVNMSHGNRMDTADTAVIGILPAPHLIAGSLSAHDRDAVFAWVLLNTTALLDHWNGTIDGGEMAQRTQRVP